MYLQVVNTVFELLNLIIKDLTNKDLL